MTLKPPQDTFVRTAAELTKLWVDLMSPDGYSVRSLWMIFLGEDGRMSPLVLPIEELPPEPDEAMLGNLRELVTNLTGDRELSPAFLLSRPGPDHVLAGDRHWATGLMTTLGQRLSPWPIHLATAGRVRVLAPDDLIAA